MSRSIIISGILLSVLFACKKADIETTDELIIYQPQDLNEKAGLWKTYILKKPDEIVISKPAALSSNEYKAEIAQLKLFTDSLNAEKEEIIKYWAAGSTLRWNEIALKLIAKYNVVPRLNAEGNYPEANPQFPLENPKFPYANSQYSARVLAALSVGQYEALVSTWHYKYLYKRINPYDYDPDIKKVLKASDIPSYPSEDASVAMVSYLILSEMFPGEKEYLQKKAEEAGYSRLWAGMNLASDISAGVKIGSEVATKVKNYLEKDGMSIASETKFLEEQRINATKIGVSTLWKSQEIPERPALYPNFGKLKPWNLPNNDFKTIRPIIPYYPDSEQWNADIATLKGNQVLTKKQIDSLNTYSFGNYSELQLGFWNKILNKQVGSSRYSMVRVARSQALLNTTLLDAQIAAFETAYFYQTPRPQAYGVKARTAVPNFPGFVALESCIAGAASTILGGIFPSLTSDFETYAQAISKTTILGRTQTHMEANQGFQYGIILGNFGLVRAQNDNSGLTQK
jgi:hypothetical protein